jgi:hypothetical protein
MLPALTEQKQKRDTQVKFRGLNRRLNTGDEEFREMYNLSSDEAPMLAPRKKRRRLLEAGADTLLGGDTLSWITGGALYYGGRKITEGIGEGASLTRMGAYLIVWPDKIIYNTHTGELSRMDYRWTGNGVHVRPCMISGQDLVYTAADTAPEEPTEGMYWYNTAVGGMYQFLGGAWKGIDTVYSRIECAGLGEGLRDYDVVTIAGMDDDDFNVDGATVYARGRDYIVIASGVLVDFENDGQVTVSRTAPELDEICENGNRLWGYSNTTHEIRSCKLGDPWNWNSYLGISTDSYAATVGSQGDFTGIYNYMGYVHFFKENRVHRLYGTQPSAYQLVELQMRGVKTGCGKSLCVVNELLYYMSRDGIVRYDGSGPVRVSEPLGDDEQMTAVVCGCHQNKLYVSAVTPAGSVIYVLDTVYGLWHQEDVLRARAFASTADGDYILDSSGVIWGIDGAESPLEAEDAAEEDDISWMAVSGDILTETTMTKRLKKIEIRLEMERGAMIDLDVMYNSDGKWLRALSYQTELKKTVVLPLMARKCDHFAIRYSGTGMVVVYAMSRVYEVSEARQPLTRRK